ncbi:rhamnose/proton symporter RhaT [Carboxylicivirga sediminis]|uniref:Rhamnose/proton symporter RhaT n=1 Tax=Carboxylicivirga sediminis TaxID=2006564 RepID=A0A941IY63_9BACT|nr:L-rhamnose/proton symporter RhaT [Carboxylicivirga sediminis]MBR8536685.1 rhamnose/proton symporter RhaT [Carboxylicivirga sediminis]
MNLNILFGICLIALGAFASGSFAIPFVKVKKWQWESYWLIFSLAAYIVFPLLSCLIFSPEYLQVFKAIPSKTLLWVFFLGAVYGIGNLSFGLSLRYLGLSLGYALSLGLMLAIGTLVPPLIDGRLSSMFNTSGGNQLITGVIVACAGIGLVGYTGYLKDKYISETSTESIREFHYSKGVLAALLVGVSGSAMSLAFEQGIPISDMAVEKGTSPFFSTNPVLLTMLSGTFITTIIWCLAQGYKNNSLRDYFKAENHTILFFNYLFCFMAGFLWFVQLFLYGMGKSRMGEYTFIAWGILMALTIAFATIWGIIQKEWRGASVKMYILLALSLIIIVVSSFLIGMSASA